MGRALRALEWVKGRVLVDVVGPGDDDFYGEPGDLRAALPGQVLDARPVEVRAIRRVLDVDAWHVRFRTTDTRRAPSYGITTVLVPRRPFGGPRRPLLSYQCAIDSLGATADPSYTLRHGDQQELPFITRALRRGWAVAATDHGGPHHAFAAGSLAARFVLDGIRAALAFEPAGLGAGTPIGLWGYSGGAQATLCAAELHPSYAPELRIVGAAAGGITVDPTTMTGTFEDVYDGSILSGIPLGAIIGVSREHPEVDLLGALTPQGRALVAAAEGMRVEQLLLSFPFLRWREYLTVPSVLEIPGLRAAFEANGFGRAAPTAAVYVYHGVHEQNLPTADADAFVDEYRRAGADVTYRRVRVGEHVLVSAIGAPGALRFLADRFATA